MSDLDTPLSEYRIGRFTVATSSRIIRDPAGRERKVDPKPMAVLLELMRSAGHPVSRDSLFDAVWGDAIVVEEALTRCISELRRAFGDTARSQRVIRTVRGSGYMLLLPVSDPTQAERSIPGQPVGRQPRTFAWGLSAFLSMLALGVLMWPWKQDPGLPPVFRTATFQDGMERSPNLSANGKWLAYVEVGDDGSGKLGVTDLESGQPMDLDWLNGTVAAVVEKAVWISDGVELLLMTGGVQDCTFVSAHLSMREIRPLGSCRGSYHRDADVSPDGLRVVFSRLTGAGLPMELVELDLSTGEQTRLTDASGLQYGDHHPAFSPDGSRVAFVRTETESDSDVFVLESQGSTVRRVTEQHAVLAGLAWRDASNIVWSSAGYGPLRLWETGVGRRLQPPKWLATGTDEAAFPTVARESGKLAFAQNRTIVDLVMREGKTERILVSNGATNTAPSLSPDGQRLAYVSDLTGSREVWILDVNSGSRRQLTFDGGWADAPAWSPDGSQLVYSRTIDGYHALWVHSLDDDSSRPLSEGPADTILPTWKPDGSGVLAASNAGGSWNLWSFPLDRDRPVRVSGGERAVRMQEVGNGGSADRWILFRQGAHPGLRVMDPRTGNERPLATGMKEVDWGGWVAEQDSVYFLVREDAGITLQSESLAIDAGPARVVARLDVGRAWSIPWLGPALTVHSSSGRIVFPRVSARFGEIRAAEQPAD